MSEAAEKYLKESRNCRVEKWRKDAEKQFTIACVLAGFFGIVMLTIIIFKLGLLP